MREVLQELFDRLGPIKPPEPAAAITGKLRAFIESRARPDGCWDICIEVAPNTRHAAEDAVDDRDVVLQGEQSFTGKQEAAGRYLFRRVPTGDYRLVAGLTISERLKELAQVLTDRFLATQRQMSTVPGFHSRQHGTIAEHDITWLLEKHSGLVDLVVQTEDPKFEGRRLIVSVAEAGLATTMEFRKLPGGIFEAAARGLPRGRLDIETNVDEELSDDNDS